MGVKNAKILKKGSLEDSVMISFMNYDIDLSSRSLETPAILPVENDVNKHGFPSKSHILKSLIEKRRGLVLSK